MVALVHYCWNQLISLLAASAESLGKIPALRHLSLLGRSRDCEQSAQRLLRFCYPYFMELFPTLPELSGHSGLPAARLRSRPPSDPQAGDADPTDFQPEICMSALQLVCSTEVFAFVSVSFFCPRSHSKLSSGPLPLARGTGEAGALLQLTWCLLRFGISS